jgi:hypothetical protein
LVAWFSVQDIAILNVPHDEDLRLIGENREAVSVICHLPAE